MVNVPNWPLTITSVAFIGDPFDSGSVFVWTDISNRVQTINTSSGRQYELDQVQAAEAAYTILDSDEALNPTNPSSPYYPFVKVFRRIADQSMYPAAPVGAAVNLLNATSGYDPSFENTAVGVKPTWVTAVGSTSPVVAASTPHSGSNSLTYSVLGTATPQGFSTSVTCIPAQQYTASVWVDQTTASTQQIAIGGLTATDRFQRTAALSGSTADQGGTWSFNGGVSGDYTTVAGAASSGIGSAFISNGSVNVDRFALLSTSAQDSDQRIMVTLPAVATGAIYTVTMVSRFTNANNQYRFGINCNTNGTVDAALFSKVAGVWTQLVVATSVINSYTTGTQVWLRFQTVGTTIQGKVWLNGTIEPTVWTVTTTDSNLTAAGSNGLHCQLSTGNTNTTPIVTFGQYRITSYTTPGTTTAATAAYTRLTATFVATQPQHSVALTTIGTAVAGSVFVDDIQLEVGATANTFASTGPVIYGNFFGYVERWPSSWNYQGTYGLAQITCVDAFAPLANTFLHTAYTQSVLAKDPAYYWRLNDGANATTFAESSGNGGPPLLRVDGSNGPATTFTPGTSISITGDPSATGVFITGTSLVSDTVTALETNQFGIPKVNIGTNTGTMGFTAAMWVQAAQGTTLTGCSLRCYATDTGTDFQMLLPSFAGFLFEAAIGSGPGGSTPPGMAYSTTSNLADNKPHLCVFTISIASNSVTTQFWIDGALSLTKTENVTTDFGSSTPDFRWTNVEVAGIVDPGLTGPGMQGTYAHVAIWNRTLSNAEISDLVNAGRGYSGETSGQRITRYLSNSYTGQVAIDIGASTMAADSLAERTAVLDGCQAVTLSENGNFFQDRNGALTFQARTDRYLQLSPKWVFGENAAGNEVPYNGDIAFDFDPTQIFNDVTVTRTGGLVAEAIDNPSQLSYGVRSYQRTINIASDLETIDAANWLLSGHKQPTQRLQGLTINPGANPAVWPVALGIHLGDRATGKRRTSAGYTMSADYFIERIEINRGPGLWQLTLQMSPASLNRQPGIFNDATYGILDQTMIFGY